MQKPIYKYNASLQKASGAKTKPEPWLHFATVRDEFVIYVWDTRQIVEHGKCNSRQCIIATTDFAKDNWQHLVGQGADIFNSLLFSKDFKVRIEHVPGRYRDDRVANFYVDDKCICRTEKSRDYFRSIKNGQPSRLRDQMKNTYNTRWQRRGLLELFGDDASEVIRLHCKDDYPDLMWGYQGHCVTKQEIEQTLQIIKAALTTNKT